MAYLHERQRHRSRLEMQVAGNATNAGPSSGELLLILFLKIIYALCRNISLIWKL